MIRWSCQRLHGCVPVQASATACASASARSCTRRSASPMQLSYLKRLEQLGRDASPAPAIDRRTPCCLAELATLVAREREQRVQLAGELLCVTCREARERAVLHRVLGLEPVRDLR